MIYKKACILYVASMAEVADTVRLRLEKDGVMVCAIEAQKLDVESAKAGSPALSEAILKCLASADLRIFLVDKEDTDCLSAAAGEAIKLEGRLVIVLGAGASPPSTLDDYADASVSAQSPELFKAIYEKDVWQTADGAAAPARPIKRVKCQ